MRSCIEGCCHEEDSSGFSSLFWVILVSAGGRKRMPLWAAEVDIRGAGWRIEELEEVSML